MLVHPAIDHFGSWVVLVNDTAVALVKQFGMSKSGLFAHFGSEEGRRARAIP